MTITLTAASGSRETEASQTVEVYKPVTISTFTVDPPRVVLYVAQTITITWNAPGASTTQITGLDNFSNTPLDPSYPAAATITSVGIPRGPMTITLTAQNEDTSVQQPFPLEVIPPQCSASGGDVPLRIAPVTSEQVIATIPSGTTVVVDAQDALSQWLRVQLTGGAHGWGERTAFTCADTFSVDDLFKELIVPTARPEFTIVPPLGTPVAAPTTATSAPLPPQPAPTAKGVG